MIYERTFFFHLKPFSFEKHMISLKKKKAMLPTKYRMNGHLIQWEIQKSRLEIVNSIFKSFQNPFPIFLCLLPIFPPFRNQSSRAKTYTHPYRIGQSGGGRTWGRKRTNDRIPDANVQERKKYKVVLGDFKMGQDS